MAIEMVEYRPGKWVKVVDGQIVGRATAKEVADWQATTRSGASASSAPLTLEVDLDLPASSPLADPGRTLDVPLRPAFERRRQQVEPSAPGAPSRPTPPAQEPGEAEADGLTLEMAIAREAAARRRQAPARAKSEEEAKAPVMVRRRLPVLEPAPAARPQLSPEANLEEPPLAKHARPQAETATADEPPRKAPAAGTPAAEPPPEQPEERTASAAGQGRNYWWIFNAHRRPVDVFLKEWLPKYKEKFGHEATLVLCHEDDLAAAQASGLGVETSPLLQPGHFYFGREDGSEPEPHKKKAR